MSNRQATSGRDNRGGAIFPAAWANGAATRHDGDRILWAAAPDAYEPLGRGVPQAGGASRLWSRQHKRRDEILCQARVLLGMKGYAAFRVRNLASDCHLSPQTVYNIVGDRSDILRATVVQHHEAMLEAAGTVQGHPNRLFAFADMLWSSAAKRPQYLRELASAFFEEPDLAETIRNWMSNTLRVELTRLADAGMLRGAIPLEQVASAMISLAAIHAREWAQDGDLARFRTGIRTAFGLLLLSELVEDQRAATEAWLRGA